MYYLDDTILDMKYTSLFTLLFIPFIASAQSIQEYVAAITTFIQAVLVPFILGIGFLLVVINVIRYFIIGSTNPDGREKAKLYLIYSILAFVLILVFWGVISIIAGATGLEGQNVPVPDFNTEFNGGGADCGTLCTDTD